MLDIVRVADRLDVVEDMISALKPPSVITSALMAMGLDRRLANRYQAAVRMRWQRHGRLEGREGRVQRYRAALERQVQLADQEGDRKAAIAGLGLLLKLEGDQSEQERSIADLMRRLSSSSLTDAEVDELAEKVGWRLEEGNGG